MLHLMWLGFSRLLLLCYKWYIMHRYKYISVHCIIMDGVQVDPNQSENGN